MKTTTITLENNTEVLYYGYWDAVDVAQSIKKGNSSKNDLYLLSEMFLDTRQTLLNQWPYNEMYNIFLNEAALQIKLQLLDTEFINSLSK